MKKKKPGARKAARKVKPTVKRKAAPRAKARKPKKSIARKTTARKAPARKAPVRKASVRKTPARKAPARKAAPKKKTPAKAASRKAPARKVVKTKGGPAPKARRLRRGSVESGLDVFSPTRGLGADSGGQSGDTEGLSREELADSESVEELVEEGQAFEAGIVSGVENAPNADAGPIRTREVPEDDVPQEYLDED